MARLLKLSALTFLFLFGAWLAISGVYSFCVTPVGGMDVTTVDNCFFIPDIGGWLGRVWHAGVTIFGLVLGWMVVRRHETPSAVCMFVWSEISGLLLSTGARASGHRHSDSGSAFGFSITGWFSSSDDRDSCVRCFGLLAGWASLPTSAKRKEIMMTNNLNIYSAFDAHAMRRFRTHLIAGSICVFFYWAATWLITASSSPMSVYSHTHD